MSLQNKVPATSQQMHETPPKKWPFYPVTLANTYWYYLTDAHSVKLSGNETGGVIK